MEPRHKLSNFWHLPYAVPLKFEYEDCIVKGGDRDCPVTNFDKPKEVKI
jgi:hypothetical protein